ncbi:DNA translocase FtsK [Pseudoxanthobacter sp.]|uniref:DNA translocase FtsK n=1 Tax=Pseudoxanthobacter sp. TaxID=1925742 RepID=UPI002FE3E275
MMAETAEQAAAGEWLPAPADAGLPEERVAEGAPAGPGAAAAPDEAAPEAVVVPQTVAMTGAFWQMARPLHAEHTDDEATVIGDAGPQTDDFTDDLAGDAAGTDAPAGDAVWHDRMAWSDDGAGHDGAGHDRAGHGAGHGAGAPCAGEAPHDELQHDEPQHGEALHDEALHDAAFDGPESGSDWPEDEAGPDDGRHDEVLQAEVLQAEALQAEALRDETLLDGGDWHRAAVTAAGDAVWPPAGELTLPETFADTVPPRLAALTGVFVLGAAGFAGRAAPDQDLLPPLSGMPLLADDLPADDLPDEEASWSASADETVAQPDGDGDFVVDEPVSEEPEDDTAVGDVAAVDLHGDMGQGDGVADDGLPDLPSAGEDLSDGAMAADGLPWAAVDDDDGPAAGDGLTAAPDDERTDDECTAGEGPAQEACAAEPGAVAGVWPHEDEDAGPALAGDDEPELPAADEGDGPAWPDEDGSPALPVTGDAAESQPPVPAGEGDGAVLPAVAEAGLLAVPPVAVFRPVSVAGLGSLKMSATFSWQTYPVVPGAMALPAVPAVPAPLPAAADVGGAAADDEATAAAARPAHYELPPLDLLCEPPQLEPDFELSEAFLDQNSSALQQVLRDFGVRGEVIDANPGPVVTLYEFEPAPGVKSSRVIGLADDIARSMSAVSTRVAVIPGRNVIGIELPNRRRDTVWLRELLASHEYTETRGRLGICLGKTIGGEPLVTDLARMPHLLVAGTTGSGKSVAINTMILSLLYRYSPEQCRLIMIDPKMLELSVYEGIPHLLTPVVTDPKKAIVALKWAVREMEERYRKMARLAVRNIDGYNTRMAEARARGETITRQVQVGFDKESGEALFEEQEMDLSPLPYIVIVVDEMADLMMVAGKDIESAIQRLAQMARAAGIHLVMATQRPSVDVITGTIKANFPTRISFQVTSKIDSRTILGEMGAETLLGQGDMLFMAAGGRITRVHGAFVSDTEVEHVVAFLKTQGGPEYLEEVVLEEEAEGPPEAEEAVFDKSPLGETSSDLYEQAVAIVLRDRKASTSYIQRRLQVGYNRAASLMERMEQEGIVGPANHAGKREILQTARSY